MATAKQCLAAIAWSTGNIARSGPVISRNMLHSRRNALARGLRPDARNDSAVARLPAALSAAQHFVCPGKNRVLGFSVRK